MDIPSGRPHALSAYWDLISNQTSSGTPTWDPSLKILEKLSAPCIALVILRLTSTVTRDRSKWRRRQLTTSCTRARSGSKRRPPSWCTLHWQETDQAQNEDASCYALHLHGPELCQNEDATCFTLALPWPDQGQNKTSPGILYVHKSQIKPEMKPPDILYLYKGQIRPRIKISLQQPDQAQNEYAPWYAPHLKGKDEVQNEDAFCYSLPHKRRIKPKMMSPLLSSSCTRARSDIKSRPPPDRVYQHLHFGPDLAFVKVEYKPDQAQNGNAHWYPLTLQEVYQAQNEVLPSYMDKSVPVFTFQSC